MFSIRGYRHKLAGQIYYKTKKKNKVKAYILLFSCSVTRAVNIALVSNLTTTEFIKSFKRLISRRGKSKIVSLIMPKLSRQGINRDHKLHNFLSSETILWKFNVPKVPWWGGQFKRLIGLTKANFYRTIGKAPLTWEKLEEVLLDIEIILNIRPLTYIEEEIDYPILTPNSLILGCDVNFPDAAPHESESETIKKRHKYIKRWKEALWKRWKHEHLVALRGKHNLKTKDKTFKINVGDVVLIKGEDNNRGHWKIGIVNHLHCGKDNIIRVAQSRSGKS